MIVGELLRGRFKITSATILVVLIILMASVAGNPGIACVRILGGCSIVLQNNTIGYQLLQCLMVGLWFSSVLTILYCWCCVMIAFPRLSSAIRVRHIKSSKVVCILTGVFWLCTGPQTMYSLFASRRSANDRSGILIMEFLEITNRCLNIFIYSAWCEWYMRGLRRLFANLNDVVPMTHSTIEPSDKIKPKMSANAITVIEDFTIS